LLGIYPREPRNKKKASKSSTQSTTFYYSKDIQYLLHEPLLSKFRDHKALAKKIGRALGRGEVGDAARLEKTQTPRITLDHIIKERYPTFTDALRDLDDALSMLFLFANLPSSSTIPPKTIALCQRLCLEFEHYLVTTHSLRKSFLSNKGIYYQATIQGQDILWIVPYKFVQRVTGDVDFRIMGTFVEFYTTLLGFVNFRLYTTIGLIYPPKFDASNDERGGELSAFTLQGRDLGSAKQQMEPPATNGVHIEITSSGNATAKAQAAVDALAVTAEQPTSIIETPESPANDDTEADQTAIDTFSPTAPDGDMLLQPSSSASTSGTLLAPFAFYLSRETPRQPLEFLLKAFGSKRVGWDAVLGDGAFTTDENNPAITHQIVDRPITGADTRVPGRIYVQPQWVWDCVNEGKLLRPDLYAPGAMLPPHLSPWVKARKGVYDPTAPLEEANGGDEVLEDGVVDVEAGEDEDESGFGEEDDDFEKDDASGKEEDENETSNTKAPTDDPIKVTPTTLAEDDWDGITSGSDDGTTSPTQHQRELEAEAHGVAVNGSTGTVDGAEAMRAKSTAAAQKQKRKDAEHVERQKQMMPRRKRKLYEKMAYGNTKRDEGAERLREKRRKMEGKA